MSLILQRKLIDMFLLTSMHLATAAFLMVGAVKSEDSCAFFTVHSGAVPVSGGYNATMRFDITINCAGGTWVRYINVFSGSAGSASVRICQIEYENIVSSNQTRCTYDTLAQLGSVARHIEGGDSEVWTLVGILKDGRRFDTTVNISQPPTTTKATSTTTTGTTTKKPSSTTKVTTTKAPSTTTKVTTTMATSSPTTTGTGETSVKHLLTIIAASLASVIAVVVIVIVVICLRRKHKGASSRRQGTQRDTTLLHPVCPAAGSRQPLLATRAPGHTQTPRTHVNEDEYGYSLLESLTEPAWPHDTPPPLPAPTATAAKRPLRGTGGLLYDGEGYLLPRPAAMRHAAGSPLYRNTDSDTARDTGAQSAHYNDDDDDGYLQLIH